MTEAQTEAQIDEANAAREELYRSARRASRYGDASRWLVDVAPRWALDRVTQREIGAVIDLVWGGW